MLSEEEVGSLDDDLEVRLSLSVEESRDVGDVDRLGLREGEERGRVRSRTSTEDAARLELTLPPQGTRISAVYRR